MVGRELTICQFLVYYVFYTVWSISNYSRFPIAIGIGSDMAKYFAMVRKQSSLQLIITL